MKYAIISDIHEDIKSLREVIKRIKKIDVDKVVCLGDITGFSNMHHAHHHTKDADNCIELVRNNCDIIVAGNHDFNSVKMLPDYLIRHRNAGSNIKKKRWAYKGEVNSNLSQKSIDFVKYLPEYFIETTEKYQILFSHFTFPDITGSTIIIPETKRELKPHFNFMKRKNCLFSFLGHTHINGFATSSGNYVHFKEFGFKRLRKKQQIIFGPAIVKDGNRSGFMVFDSESFELAIIKIDV